MKVAAYFERINYRSMKIPYWAKYLIAILPFVYIFWHTDVHRLADTLHKIAWWTIPVLVSIFISCMFLNGLKWWVLLKEFIRDLPFWETMSYHFIGIFYSIILPSSLGLDVVRTVLISRKNDYGFCWGATWVCKIIGLLMWALLSLYGILTLDKSRLPRSFGIYAAVAFLAVGLMFYLSFSKRATRPFRSFLLKVISRKTLETFERIREGIFVFRGRKKALAGVTILSLIVQFSLICGGCLIVKGINGHMFLSVFMTFIPVIELVASLPLTPGGLGVREALTAIMLGSIGLSKEQIGTYILISVVFSILTKLIGGLPLLYDAVTAMRAEKEVPKTGRDDPSSMGSP